MRAGRQIITVKGLVIPVDWNEKGRATRALVSTHSEEEYFIEKDKMGGELLNYVQKEVEVTGVLRRTGGKNKITVKGYNL